MMLLYFSATGNCKYIAKRLSEATGEDMLSIVDCFQKGRLAFRDERIGIISPTYFWALPPIVRRFLESSELTTDYLYFVATYGTTTGAVRQYAEKALGRRFDACFCVRMADNYTPMFDISTPEKLSKFTETTEQETEKLIESVLQCRRVRRMSPSLPRPLVMLTAQVLYETSARKTSNLWVRDSCIGCGKCAKKCPDQAIEMRDGRPFWVKDKCELCLGCLHRCPVFAIQYGNGKTAKHGQYTNPNVTL